MAGSVMDDINDIAFQLWGENYRTMQEYLALFENPSRDKGAIRSDLKEALDYRKREQQVSSRPSQEYLDL